MGIISGGSVTLRAQISLYGESMVTGTIGVVAEVVILATMFADCYCCWW